MATFRQLFSSKRAVSAERSRPATPISPLVAPSIVREPPEDLLLLVLDHLPFEPGLLTVSHVSRHWRAIALSHPTYWKHLSLTCNATTLPQWLLVKIVIFEARLAASTKDGLEVTISFSRDGCAAREELDERIVQALRLHAHRLQSLAIRIWFCRSLIAPVINLFEQGVRMPCLQRLELVDLTLSPPLRMSQSVLRCAPNLRALCLAGTVLGLDSQADTQEFPASLERISYEDVELIHPGLRMPSSSPSEYGPEVLQAMYLLPGVRHFSLYANPSTGAILPSQLKTRLLGSFGQLQSLGLQWTVLHPLLTACDGNVAQIPTLKAYCPAGTKPPLDFLCLGHELDSSSDLHVAFIHQTVDVYEPSSGRRRRAVMGDALWSLVIDICDVKHCNIAQRMTHLALPGIDWVNHLPLAESWPGSRLDTLVLAAQHLTPLRFVPQIARFLDAPMLRVIRMEAPTSNFWFVEPRPADALITLPGREFGEWVHRFLEPKICVKLTIEVGPGVRMMGRSHHMLHTVHTES